MRIGWRILCALALASAIGCGEDSSAGGEGSETDAVQGSDTLDGAGEETGGETSGETGFAASSDVIEDVGSGLGDVADGVDVAPDVAPECTTDEECDEPLSCIEEACSCPGGASACGAYCVDLATDPQHCGECDNLCFGGAKCKEGECSCVGAGTPALCGNQCVDLDSDALHCGECDLECPVGSGCVAGACACEEGLALCVGACVDVLTSFQHCGGCEQACEALETCFEGACVLPAGPRPLAPVSTSQSTGAGVTLRWEPSIVGETRLEICADSGCQVVVQEETLAPGIGEHGVELTKGVHFWRVRSVVEGSVVDSADGNPVWQLQVGGVSAADSATTWGAVPDFDLDGFADVIVGACGLSGTGCGSSVFVFQGAEGGIDRTQPTIISGPPVGTFGNSTSSAGDENGDG